MVIGLRLERWGRANEIHIRRDFPSDWPRRKGDLRFLRPTPMPDVESVPGSTMWVLGSVLTFDTPLSSHTLLLRRAQQIRPVRPSTSAYVQPLRDPRQHDRRLLGALVRRCVPCGDRLCAVASGAHRSRATSCVLPAPTAPPWPRHSPPVAHHNGISRGQHIRMCGTDPAAACPCPCPC
jgi:hypothetical protein